MIHGGHFASCWSGSLLLVGSTLAKCKDACASVTGKGYALDGMGMAEALWCWPIDGYDLVLIDATDHPAEALELCEHIKRSRPRQKIALLLGNRSGRLPFRTNVDAVFTGEPDGRELAHALHFLLREQSSPVRP
jgi:CheY-like chemotaxis protein